MKKKNQLCVIMMVMSFSDFEIGANEVVFIARTTDPKLVLLVQKEWGENYLGYLCAMST